MLSFTFKSGVIRDCKPELASWMERICFSYFMWFGERPVVTSVYRHGAGGHGRREAFDLRRRRHIASSNYEAFCKWIQEHHGRYIGVVLEPEWGKGTGYTGPHLHFQLKEPARWN